MRLLRRHVLTGLAALPLGMPPAPLPPPWEPARLSPFSVLQPAPARSAVILLDAGHGGRDPGCTGASGIHEKAIALDVTLAVAERLGGTGCRAELTRTDDRFVAIPDRVAQASAVQADFLLSIHADSAPTPLARGASTYTLARRASDGFAADLARRENRDLPPWDDEPPPPPGPPRPADRAERLAQHLQQHLIRNLRPRVRLLENPMRAADFAVLKTPGVPAVLLELGFLSSAPDEQLLRDAGWRRDIAGWIADSLADFAAAGLAV